MVGYIRKVLVMSFIAGMAPVSVRATELPAAATFCFDSPGMATLPTGIDSIMRVWGYVQDLNTHARSYSTCEYDLCIYTVIGMILCAQAAFQTQPLLFDDERAYCARVLSLLEQECSTLRLSILQSRLMKESLNSMRAVLR